MTDLGRSFVVIAYKDGRTWASTIRLGGPGPSLSKKKDPEGPLFLLTTVSVGVVHIFDEVLEPLKELIDLFIGHRIVLDLL